MLIARTKNLVNCGANVLAIACNTAHLLFSELSAIKGANFISMIDSVVSSASQQNLKRVGILATPTTIKLKLYQDKLSSAGLKSFTLPLKDQRKYEQVIRSVVAGKTTKTEVDYLFTSTAYFVNKYHLDSLILGCTELPLIFPKEKFNFPILDSLDILAESIVNYNVKI